MNDEMLEFVDQLSTWHANRVDHLRAIQDSVRKGTVLKVGDEDEDGSVMTARDVAFFKCGMEAALMELGRLPFTVSQDTDEEIEGGDA